MLSKIVHVPYFKHFFLLIHPTFVLNFGECGGAYYKGKCFVFDDRIAVNSCLEETKETTD